MGVTKVLFPNFFINSSPPDKMATILADNIFNCIFMNENDTIPIQLSLHYVSRSPIDNKPALAQVLAWRQIGNKPLPEPVMTHSVDTYEALRGDELTDMIWFSKRTI